VEIVDQFGRLERVTVRDGPKDEAKDFTPWRALKSLVESPSMPAERH
jgi:hypothetical protein